MKRRDFLKSVVVLIGSAALPPAVLAAIPETVPDDFEVSIGYYVDGRFNKWGTTTVSNFSGSNRDVIAFPRYDGHGYYVMSHACVGGVIVPLERHAVISCGVQPMFSAGSLTIMED